MSAGLVLNLFPIFVEKFTVMPVVKNKVVGGASPEAPAPGYAAGHSREDGGRLESSRSLFGLFSENLSSEGPHDVPLRGVDLLLGGERIPLKGVKVVSVRQVNSAESPSLLSEILDASFVAADGREFPWVFRHDWNGLRDSYGNFPYRPAGDGPVAAIEDESALARKVFSGYAKLNVIDNLEWFDSLGETELLQALSFYRKEDLFDGPDMTPPGFIRNAADRERLWAVRDVVTRIPFDIPDVDGDVIENGVRTYILKELREVSVGTLYQMRRELSASGLGKGHLENLPRDDGNTLGATWEIEWQRTFALSFFYLSYSLADKTREVIGGELAKDFAGEAHWSRALDFEAPGVEDFKGLRYIDFKDYTNVHALYKNGESKVVDSLSTYDLMHIFEGLRAVSRRLIKKSMKELPEKPVRKKGRGL